MNKEASLNLYAKIEPLIGFYDDYERLYDIYLKIITSLKPQKILDFGCGNGRLSQILTAKGFDTLGIDLSSDMIERALLRGVRAKQTDIKELEGEFDLIIAAADVLNYFDALTLDDILHTICQKLSPKGFLIADINTLHGFRYVAEGLLAKESESGFLVVDADFEDKELTTNFTFFEKSGEMYKKEAQTITQYFHTLEYFKKTDYFTLKQTLSVFLFDDKNADKTLMLLQKK